MLQASLNELIDDAAGLSSCLGVGGCQWIVGTNSSSRGVITPMCSKEQASSCGSSRFGANCASCAAKADCDEDARPNRLDDALETGEARSSVVSKILAGADSIWASGADLLCAARGVRGLDRLVGITAPGLTAKACAKGGTEKKPAARVPQQIATGARVSSGARSVQCLGNGVETKDAPSSK